MAFGKKCLDQALSLGLPRNKVGGGGGGYPSLGSELPLKEILFYLVVSATQVTLGLPFYGRFLSGGDWRSYEDLIKALPSLPRETDVASLEGRPIAFNGAATIGAKTSYALERGAGGVMIWEIGQDCREV